jgi:hypothetical protein
MPANMKQRGLLFSVIAQEAIDWYESFDKQRA